MRAATDRERSPRIVEPIIPGAPDRTRTHIRGGPPRPPLRRRISSRAGPTRRTGRAASRPAPRTGRPRPPRAFAAGRAEPYVRAETVTIARAGIIAWRRVARPTRRLATPHARPSDLVHRQRLANEPLRREPLGNGCARTRGERDDGCVRRRAKSEDAGMVRSSGNRSSSKTRSGCSPVATSSSAWWIVCAIVRTQPAAASSSRADSTNRESRPRAGSGLAWRVRWCRLVGGAASPQRVIPNAFARHVISERSTSAGARLGRSALRRPAHPGSSTLAEG